MDTPSGPPEAIGGLRCHDDLAPRPGVSCDVTRATPLPRPLLRLDTVHRLAGSFLLSRAVRLLTFG
ncbi:MAG: hypothetical protein WCJ02_14055 [bacterium]